MGMNQKQAVAVLYGVSAVLGLIAVLLAGDSAQVRIACLVAAFAVSIIVWLFVFQQSRAKHAQELLEQEEEQKNP